MKKIKLYPTYEEAKRAVAVRNIKSHDEYTKRYKEDPRLPSNPNTTYANKGWIDWYDFLGKPTKVFYPTFEKVKRAVQRLNIKSQSEYYEHYKEDPRLPSQPYNIYADKGWINWFNLFGKPTPVFYSTYKEAKRAVQRLNIKTSTEYQRYKEDPRLPSVPYVFYKDKGWIDWYDFLGKPRTVFYPIYKEAKRAVKRLNIKNQIEYHKRYKEDPRLPSNPNATYANKGWIDWFDFFRKVKK